MEGSVQIIKEELADLPYKMVIPKEKVESIIAKTRLPLEQLLDLLCFHVAKPSAHPPISNFYCGAASYCPSGNIYLGGNVEFEGYPLNRSIHAEQAMICNVLNNGEKEVTLISTAPAPCGHCRQWFRELHCSDSIQCRILDTNTGKLIEKTSLPGLLPFSFSPKDLGCPSGALMWRMDGNVVVNPPKELETNDPFLTLGIEAIKKSYSPHTLSPASVVIATKNGYSVGSYIENAAYNPSLGPFHAAVVGLLGSSLWLPDISRVLILQREGAPICHEEEVMSIVMKFCPSASVTTLKVTFQ